LSRLRRICGDWNARSSADDDSKILGNPLIVRDPEGYRAIRNQVLKRALCVVSGHPRLNQKRRPLRDLAIVIDLELCRAVAFNAQAAMFMQNTKLVIGRPPPWLIGNPSELDFRNQPPGIARDSRVHRSSRSLPSRDR
jgi:hypothetical protein